MAVAMLALGIGATTTIFSVANALMLRPLNGGATAENDLVRTDGDGRSVRDRRSLRAGDGRRAPAGGVVMSEGAGLIAVGRSLGLLRSAGVLRMLAGWVYGVGGFEPAVFGVTAVLLGAAMLLACYVPARRAAGVPPAVALRSE